MTQQKQILSLNEFKMFQKLIYDEIGIFLADHKLSLVQSRLRKWLLEFQLESYKELHDKIKEDKSGQMLTILVNAITTNVTSFFREETQWIYLQNHFNEFFDMNKKRLRIWSSACSSGQEPYSIIMFLKEHLPNFEQWDIKILATDISQEILLKAQQAIYEYKDIETMPPHMIIKYFYGIRDDDGVKKFMIKDELKEYITFRTFNLVTGNFHIFKKQFDIIFCRNVMIYFDKKTQDKLFDKFATLLNENSRLFIGHSESIHNKNKVYKLVTSSIYKLNKG